MSTPIVPEFESITRREIFDALCDAYDLARSLAAGNARWASALDRAWGWLLEQDTIAYDVEHWAIRVQSATHPGVVYVANGDCTCPAFAHGNACWHRAAARLVRRALEGELAAVAAEWDAGIARARVQAEVDELFPPRLAA